MSNIFYPRALVTIQTTLENFAEGGQIIAFDTTPQSLSIKRNSYKQPDSWSIEFDAKDFPIPPALVRSGSVKIFLYDSKNQELTRKQVIESGFTIAGLIDEIQTDFTEDGRITRMDGQDYTALFSEHKFQKKRVIPGDRLDVALRKLLREVDPQPADKKRQPAMKLKLELPFGASQLPSVGKDANKTNKRRGFPVKAGDTYWDVMYKLALKHGFILFVRGLELVLTLPQYQLQADSPRSTFALSWGYNVSSINMSRHMGKQKVPQVEIKAYDDSRRETISAKFPPTGQKVSTGIGTKRNEILTSVVYGVKDRTTLKRLAESFYTLLARTEQEVEISTNDMVDNTGENSLLNISAGDALFVKFQPYNRELLQKIKNTAERAQWLLQRGFTPQAANVIAQNLEVLDVFEKPFHIREADIDYSIEDGFSLSMRCVNFVTKDGQQGKGEVKGAAEV